MDEELEKSSISKEYGFLSKNKKDIDLISVNENRAIHEVQASFVIAKKFPRNESESFSKIINACRRPFLAEQAIYAYPKGGKLVEGPSIRLAEVLLSSWGNCESGVIEISQSNGISIAQSYAIDLETNTRVIKTFHVTHKIWTKNGIKHITDPRDIYELIANQGARRMRSCILAIIPADISEAAKEECKKTLANSSEPISERIRKLILAFQDDFGIKVEHLEKKLGHKLDSIIETELVTLRGIYRSLRDGMSSREDFFDLGLESKANNIVEELINNKNKKIIT